MSDYVELPHGTIPFPESAATMAEGMWFVHAPEYSDWRCYMFGSDKGNGICWRPIKGKEPNAFWRWMQFICFGNRWEKGE